MLFIYFLCFIWLPSKVHSGIIFFKGQNLALGIDLSNLQLKLGTMLTLIFNDDGHG